MNNRRMLVLQDDEECKRVSLEVGRLAIPHKTPGFTASWTFFDYNGTYCMCRYAYNHPEAINNGYTIIALPQSEWTKEQAERTFLNLMNAQAKPGAAMECIELPQESAC